MSSFGMRTRGGSAQSDSVLKSTLLTLHTAVQQVLITLQKTNATQPDFASAPQQFWTTYRLQAEEYDSEFLTRHNGDTDISMVFAGLFCAVCASFVILIQPQLKTDPNDVTHAFLAAIILTMNGTIPPGLPSPTLPPPPSSAITWAQSFLLASLGIGLYASVGAVMGKQWLNHYDRVGVRGALKDRGMERQRKLDALIQWNFHSVLESLPFLLEASLFLFAIGLSTFLWDQQRVTGVLYMVINLVGAILYAFITVTAARYPDCPFQTPFSLRLRRLALFCRSSWQSIILPSIKQASGQARQYCAIVYDWLLLVLKQLTYKISPLIDIFLVKPVRAVWGALSRCFSDTLATTSFCTDRGGLARPSDSTELRGDIENLAPNPGPSQAQPVLPAHLLRRVWEKLNALIKFRPSQTRDRTLLQSGDTQRIQSSPWSLHIPTLLPWFKREHIPNDSASKLPAPPTDTPAASVAWILDTCTDPSVESVALEYMLDTDWPENFDFRSLLDRFFNGFIDCFERTEDGDINDALISASQKPSGNTVYGRVFLFLYWHARSVSPDSTGNWDCWLDGTHDLGMFSSLNCVPRDELDYIYLLIRETVYSHPNLGRVIGDLFPKVPAPHVWAGLSQTTAVALSRYWYHTLPFVANEDDR